MVLAEKLGTELGYIQSEKNITTKNVDSYYKT
jgi:hypothetical protein